METATTSQKSRHTIVVLEEGSQATVTVSPQNRDRFCLGVNDAIKGCQIVGDQMEFCFQVADLQNRLAAWIEERRDRIHCAYVTLRGADKLLFVVVQQAVPRDADLIGSLMDLDIDVACDPRFNRLNLEVLSVPRVSREALSAFLSSGEVMQHAEHDVSQGGG